MNKLTKIKLRNHAMTDKAKTESNSSKSRSNVLLCVDESDLRAKFDAATKSLDESISVVLQENRQLRYALAAIADHPNGLNDCLTFSTARKIAKAAVYGT